MQLLELPLFQWRDFLRTKKVSSLENEQNIDAIDEICGLLAQINDKKLIYEFFGCLFTAAELKDFSNRHSVFESSQSLSLSCICALSNFELYVFSIALSIIKCLGNFQATSVRYSLLMALSLIIWLMYCNAS